MSEDFGHVLATYQLDKYLFEYSDNKTFYKKIKLHLLDINKSGDRIDISSQ